MARRLRVGSQAPSFDLPGTGDRTYKLSDFFGKGVVIAFYPRDFTPVCTKQFCSYRDDGDRIESLGLEMIGISPQSVESHERFVAENGLSIPLLADEDKKVSRLYGVVGPGGMVRRSLFIIDADGIVRYRHVALFGLHYQDVADIERAAELVR